MGRMSVPVPLLVLVVLLLVRTTTTTTTSNNDDNLMNLKLTAVAGAVSGDEITWLPGFNQTLPSRQYSGYFNVGGSNPGVDGRYLHYWLVESEGDPSTDPVVIWFNGGPGCSSLFAVFEEHGPFRFVNDVVSSSSSPRSHTVGDHTTDAAVPQLELNQYRWNQLATIVFVEAPAGVGFSYADNSNDYNTNDNITAADNFKMLELLFAAYPEYANNDLYIAGESYAGIYVPTLVNQIMLHNDAGQTAFNLQGFLVGNGCTGNEIGSCSNAGTKIGVDFLFGHGLYSQRTHAAVYTACPDFVNPSPTCQTALNQMGTEVGAVNVYDVYGPCVNGGNDGVANEDKSMSYTPWRAQSSVIGPVECLDGIVASQYLNDAGVRSALHVAPVSNVPAWLFCTDVLNYSGSTPTLLNLYPSLIKRYRTLIYSGDTDAAVPYNDSEQWTSSLGFPVTTPWTTWTVNGQVAGYKTVYGVNNFTFLTIRGSGHMVPQFKPVEAFAMFQRYLEGQPF